MTASKFKEDMISISGITCKKISVIYFCGLRPREEADNQDEE